MEVDQEGIENSKERGPPSPAHQPGRKRPTSATPQQGGGGGAGKRRVRTLTEDGSADLQTIGRELRHAFKALGCEQDKLQEFDDFLEDLKDIEEVDDDDWKSQLDLFASFHAKYCLSTCAELFLRFARSCRESTTVSRIGRDLYRLADPSNALIEQLQKLHQQEPGRARDRQLKKLWEKDVATLLWKDPVAARQFILESGEVMGGTVGADSGSASSATKRLTGSSSAFNFAEEFFSCPATTAKELQHYQVSLKTLKELDELLSCPGENGESAAADNLTAESMKTVNEVLVPKLFQGNSSLARKWVAVHASQHHWLQKLPEDLSDPEFRRARLEEVSRAYFAFETIRLSDYNKVTSRFSADQMREVL